MLEKQTDKNGRTLVQSDDVQVKTENVRPIENNYAPRRLINKNTATLIILFIIGMHGDERSLECEVMCVSLHLEGNGRFLIF